MKANMSPARITELMAAHFIYQQDPSKNNIPGDDDVDDDAPPLLPYAQPRSSPPHGAGPTGFACEPQMRFASRSPSVGASAPTAVARRLPVPPPPYPGELASRSPSVVAEVAAASVARSIRAEVPLGPELVGLAAAVVPADVRPAQQVPINQVPVAARHRAPPRGRGSLARALHLLADHGSPGRASQREARALRYGAHVPRVLKRPPAGVRVRHPVSTRWFYEAI
jgi:hypothetical protein